MHQHSSLLIEKLTNMTEEKAQTAMDWVLKLNNQSRQDKAVTVLNAVTGVRKNICEDYLLNLELATLFEPQTMKNRLIKAINLVYLGVPREKISEEINISYTDYLNKIQTAKVEQKNIIEKRKEEQIKNLQVQQEIFIKNILKPLEDGKEKISYQYLKKNINDQSYEQIFSEKATLENILKTLSLTQKEKDRILKERNQEKLLDKNDIVKILSITPEEYKKWTMNERLPIFQYKKVKRNGRDKILLIHKYGDIEKIKSEHILKWREKDKVIEEKNKIKTFKKLALEEKVKKSWAEKIESLKKDKYYLSQEKNTNPLIQTWYKKVMLSVTLAEHKAICYTLYPLQIPVENTLGFIYRFSKVLKTHFEQINAEQLTLTIEKELNLALQDVPSDIDSINKEKILAKLRENLLSGIYYPNLNYKFFKKSIEEIINYLQHLQQTTKIRSELQLENYQAGFPLARQMKREFKIIIGPTNSGKTYEALQALKNAKSGVYLAPLRLLALEIYDKLNHAGVYCSLHTGEEHVDVPGATHVASTVEMLNPTKPVEVAVIDEIQMIHDKQRGWAWTSALVGVPAEKIYVIGSQEGLASTQALLNHLGESYSIEELERKCPLEVMKKAVSLKEIEAGDAVIAFSRKNVLGISQSLQKMGWHVSTIYGSLSPEVRRKQAENFNRGITQVVVSTDAIGMGLNLPAKRIIFSTIEKFDGQINRKLTGSEVHQIAGRAGRFGLHSKGEVSAFDKKALDYLHEKLAKLPNKGLQKVELAPSLEHINKLSNILSTDKLAPILSFFVNKIPIDHPLYQTANLEEPVQLASWADHFGKKLSLKERFYYSCAPVSVNKEEEFQYFQECLSKHNEQEPMSLFHLPHWIKKKNYQNLDRAEILSKQLSIYAWFSYKFPEIYIEKENISEYRTQLADYIEQALKKK